MIPMQLISPSVKRTASRVVRWATIDSLVGAVGGAIFGGLFGGIGILIDFEPSQIASIAGYFALCGGAAGALVGMCGGLVDAAVETETVWPSPRSATPSMRQVDPVRESAIPGLRQTHNRLASNGTAVPQRREVAASQNPSWN